MGDRNIQLPEANASRRANNLVQRMRGRTTDLHASAEQSGVVAAILGGQVCRSRYALYLRNLLPAYETMEHALCRPPDFLEVEGLAAPQLFRAASIIADLENLAGSDWAASVPLLSSGKSYASRIAEVGTDARLIAHCYTRYLGDLNGGLLLAKRLVDTFGSNFGALAFTRFSGIHDLQMFREGYRRRLDQAGDGLQDPGPVVEEAAVAFQLNIEVSVQVANHRLGGRSPA